MVQTRYKKSEEVRARILDAAEELFASKGFEATSVRDITGAAGVRGAGVNYYFSTKRELAIEVVRRRLGELMTLREEALAELDLGAGPAAARLQGVIEAFVSPLAKLTRNGGDGWANYNRIIAQLILAKEYPADAFGDRVDAVAGRFIDAFATIFPKRPRGDAVQAYRFMLSAVAVAICESDRFARLSEPEGAPPEIAEDPARIVRFLTSGVLALLSSAAVDD